jgi:hypothetical protein
MSVMDSLLLSCEMTKAAPGGIPVQPFSDPYKLIIAIRDEQTGNSISFRLRRLEIQGLDMAFSLSF